MAREIIQSKIKAGFKASGLNVSPTGIELADLLAEAVQKLRSDGKLIDNCLED